MKLKRATVQAVAVLAAVLLAGCGHGGERLETEALPAVTVRSGATEERTLARAQWLPGTVHPEEQAAVAAKLMATVAQADFVIGQAVTQGEVLVVLQANEIEAQLEEARAAVAQVERNLAREQALLAQSATTAEAVRTLEDQRRFAKARLDEALTMEGYKSIRAPFDGIITSKAVRRGDLAQPGVTLLTIEGRSMMQVYVQVPDSLSALADGSPVQLEADGRRLEGLLAEWSPAADPASRTRLAKLNLPADAAVRSGQYVRVNWPAGEATSVWMPAAALSPLGQMERVFVVEDGMARLRLVKTGRRDGAWIQVLSGLGAGERVVLDPPVQLRDGQAVNLQS